MASSSRSVLFELLYSGLIDIRAASGGTAPMTDDDRDFVNCISNLLHNLPHRLEAAQTDADFDELLAGLARSQRPIDAKWVRAHLERLEIDPDTVN